MSINGKITYKEVFPLDDTIANGPPDACANACLIIVLGLGGRVDAPETVFECLIYKIGRLVLFPCCAVDKFGDGGFCC